MIRMITAGAVAALILAACDATGTVVAVQGADPAGYTLDVLAQEPYQIYVVSAPDGRRVAARAAKGEASAIIEPPQALLGIAANAAAENAPGDAKINIQAPGFSLMINADDKAEGEEGRARIDINAGGQRVFVDAQGDGEDGNAVVHIAGVDADAARDFIDDADDLSAETRADMRRALGL